MTDEAIAMEGCPVKYHCHCKRQCVWHNTYDGAWYVLGVRWREFGRAVAFALKLRKKP